MREILLEMYEKLWEADKDKFAWNVILKETLEKLKTFNTKEEIHPDSVYGRWMKRFNPEDK